MRRSTDDHTIKALDPGRPGPYDVRSTKNRSKCLNLISRRHIVDSYWNVLI